MPAKAVHAGDTIATFSGKRAHPTYRRVNRAEANGDGTVSIHIAGSVVPQVLDRDAPVVVRIRRTR